jgi:pimeloyl-ACP methyl ester carboxylesterase
MMLLNTAHGTTIAYDRHAAFTQPGLVYLGGFRSDRQGTKARYVHHLCQALNLPFIRFDYTGHGESSGCFEEGNLSLWLQDTLAVIDTLTEGPQILVGSSMGAWLMVLAALRRPARIKALIGIAAAPDFTDDFGVLSPAQQHDLETKGFCEMPSHEGAPYKITQQFIEDSQQHRILNGSISVDCSVHLLHGLADESVAWQQSVRLAEQLGSQAVEVLLLKGGDHRLSTEPQLHILEQTIRRLVL